MKGYSKNKAMRYTNKGHELDKDGAVWAHEQKEYFLWGAAGKGATFIQRYRERVCIKGIIDRDTYKRGTMLQGVRIYLPDEVDFSHFKIIICTEAYNEVSKYLDERGLKENIDYIDYKKFAALFDWYVDKRVYLNRVDVSVTNRCTLRCDGCNMLMPNYCKPLDRNLDEIKNDLDALFKWVDIVENLNLLGGEPLLYTQLGEVIEYIWEKYKHRVVHIYIFTNGTCILADDLAEIAKRAGIIFDISDYTVGVPQIANRVKSFLDKLQQWELKYNLKKMDSWIDFGFETADHSQYTEEQRIAFFQSCNAPFRGLRNGKLFFCHIEANAIELGELEEWEGDAFLLDNFASDRRIELLEFDFGYSMRGYPMICMRCEGFSSKKKIDVALQRKRNDR